MYPALPKLPPSIPSISPSLPLPPSGLASNSLQGQEAESQVRKHDKPFCIGPQAGRLLLRPHVPNGPQTLHRCKKEILPSPCYLHLSLIVECFKQGSNVLGIRNLTAVIVRSGKQTYKDDLNTLTRLVCFPTTASDTRVTWSLYSSPEVPRGCCVVAKTTSSSFNISPFADLD